MNQPIKIIQARLPGFPNLRQVNINSDGLIALATVSPRRALSL